MFRRILGYQGYVIHVDEEFIPQMDVINQHAIDCNVEILVTHAYRSKNSGSGFVSNFQKTHPALIGHSIQFNIQTPRQWCSDRCIIKSANKEPEDTAGNKC